MNNEIQNKIADEQLPALRMADVYDLVDINDVINHLKKAVTDKWAYKFKFSDGKVAKGLGIVGARETAVILAKLSKGQHVIRAMKIMRLEETAESWDSEVLVGLYVVGIINEKPVELLLNTIIGTCRQPKLGVRQDGSTWVINHPDKLSVSKSTRKGIESFIPDKWAKKIVEVAEREGKIHDETEESENGSAQSKKATTKQTNAIKGLMNYKYVDNETNEHYKAALDKGMTSYEASRAIQTLNKIIEAGKEKEEKKNEPSLM